MTAIHVYALRCDGGGCKAVRFSAYARVVDARDAAAANSGWTARPNVKTSGTVDLCDDCSKLAPAAEDGLAPTRQLRMACATCNVAGHNSRTCPQVLAAKTSEHDDADAAPPMPARSFHRRPLPYALRKLEARRIVDEANPVNPRGTLPTPISSWVF